MQDDRCLWVLEGADRIRRQADEAWLGAQVKAEAVAAAQERLEASKAALEQRREELLAKEAALKEAARAAEAATSAAAAREERLKAREVASIPPQTVQDCSNRRVSCSHSAFPSLFGSRQSLMGKHLAQATAKEHDAQLRRAREALEEEQQQLAAQKGAIARRHTQVHALWFAAVRC